jgi:hypothetical protein
VKSLKITHVSFAMSVHLAAHKTLGTMKQIFMKFDVREFY